MGKLVPLNTGKEESNYLAEQTSAPIVAQGQRGRLTQIGTGLASDKLTGGQSDVRQNDAVSDKLTESEYNRSTAMQRKHGSYQNYLVGATADGKFYSQPEIGKDTEKLRKTYTTYETETQKALTSYQNAAKKQKETEDALGRFQQSLPALKQNYAKNPSVFNNAIYQTELQQYKDLAERYEQETANTQKLYSDYEQSYG